MTEKDYYSSTNFPQLVEFVTTNPDYADINCVRSPRKLRLFCCALAREYPFAGRRFFDVPKDVDPACILFAENVADHGFVGIGSPSCHGEGVSFCLQNDIMMGVRGWLTMSFDVDPEAPCNIFRDITGNPFHEVKFCPYCPPADIKCCPVAAKVLTPQVISLAEVAYEERLENFSLDPERLGILSDALEEAGCEIESLLTHLRSPGVHYRGVWSLDVVLGKS